jgi:hypothetical protein
MVNVDRHYSQRRFPAADAATLPFKGRFQVTTVEETHQRVADGLDAEDFTQIQAGHREGQVFGERLDHVFLGLRNALYDPWCLFSADVLARNLLYGPGLITFDASLFKNIPVTERWKFQLRAEVFSLFNTPAFSNPSATSGTSSSFGTDGSTKGNNRQIQFA